MKSHVFTVSIEVLDGTFILCPLGDVPPGFSDLDFTTEAAAEAWLKKWAKQRKLRLDPLQPGEWRVSPSLPENWIIVDSRQAH